MPDYGAGNGRNIGYSPAAGGNGDRLAGAQLLGEFEPVELFRDRPFNIPGDWTLEILPHPQQIWILELFHMNG